MRKLKNAVAVACTFVVIGCNSNGIVENFPSYDVRGTVRTAGGAAVPAALVELRTYGEAGCGTGPLMADMSSITSLDGQYHARVTEPSGVLNGCIRVVAHPDTSSASEPTAVVDLPVDNVQVIEGVTVFTVDLTLP